MEELFKELSEFVRKNRKVFKLTEQWLKEFDGNLDDAWNVAKNALIVDWRKIVLVVKRTLDEGVEFLLNTILSGSYTTREHPNIYLIRNALNEGKNRPEDKKEPVSKRAGLIYDKLKSLTPPKHGMTTNELLDWLSQERENIDEKTLRRHLNELKPYGLDNKRRIGYYLK